MRIDHRYLPGRPPWRLTDGEKNSGMAAAAHLTKDLSLVWLEENWLRPVRLRRVGDDLVGRGEGMGGSDSLRIPLPAGAPFFTDLSLLLHFSTWPVAPGWEERGAMVERRRSLRVVPVRIRVVGEAIVPTRIGVVDCWIVVVHGPPDSRRPPHWYWVSKRDRLVVMRRHYLPNKLDEFDEDLLRAYPTESDILIDIVVAGPPRMDAGPIVAVERALAPRYHVQGQNWDDDTLYRFVVSANPDRQLASADSLAIARLLDSAGYGGRYRVEPPTDRSFVRVPRDGELLR